MSGRDARTQFKQEKIPSFPTRGLGCNLNEVALGSIHVVRERS